MNIFIPGRTERLVSPLPAASRCGSSDNGPSLGRWPIEQQTTDHWLETAYFPGKRRALALWTCGSAIGRIAAGAVMLKQMAIAPLLSVAVFAQTHTPIVRFEQFDEFRKIKCKDRVPENFGCAILFDVDFPSSGNMIASVVGGFVHQVSLILDSTMYTVMYEPPLKTG